MKIAIISPWAITATSIGGTERFVIDIATGLKAKGHDVQVFMLSGRESLIGEVKYTSLQLFDDGPATEGDLIAEFSPLTSLSIKRIGELLENRINSAEFDVVIMNSLLFMNAYQNKPRLFVIHTNPQELKLDWGSEGFQVLTDIAKGLPGGKLTTFVAPSQFYADEYSRLFNSAVSFIPHSIDIDRLVQNRKKESILKKFGLSPDLIKIFIPGRLEAEQKQPMLVLEACALIPKPVRNKIELMFSGLDNHYMHEAERLKSFAQSHDIQIKVFNLDNMRQAYAVANVVILPSRFESFGYTALESLYLGKKTIINDIPTYREIAAGALNVSFFNGSAEDLSKAIKAALQDYSSKKQSIRWTNKYSYQHWIEKYQALLESIFR